MPSAAEALPLSSLPPPDFERIREKGIRLMHKLYEADPQSFTYDKEDDKNPLDQLEREVIADVQQPSFAKKEMIWWLFSETETRWLFEQYRTDAKFRDAVQGKPFHH